MIDSKEFLRLSCDKCLTRFEPELGKEWIDWDEDTLIAEAESDGWGKVNGDWLCPDCYKESDTYKQMQHEAFLEDQADERRWAKQDAKKGVI